jgi:hypothetical protein
MCPNPTAQQVRPCCDRQGSHSYFDLKKSRRF